jgi:hypothetical protein
VARLLPPVGAIKSAAEEYVVEVVEHLVPPFLLLLHLMLPMLLLLPELCLLRVDVLLLLLLRLLHLRIQPHRRQL